MFATLEASALGDDIRIESFKGTETMCRPYEFDIQFTVIGSDETDLAKVIGSNAKLKLARADENPHVINGVIASIRLLIQTTEWALYEATVVPKLWRLGITKHSNVWTKTSIPDIIKDVLDNAEMTDYELRLTDSYDPEELVIQYHESKLHFLQRWMEHEGIYYFFEQGDGSEKMIICDANSAHSKMADKAVRYYPLMGHDASAGECFDTFTLHHNTTVKSVRVSDYDYSRPALDLSSETDVSDNGVGRVSVHGSRFFDPSQAKRFAKLRAEELKAQEVVQHASGSVLHMGAGYLYELSEHPQDKLNTPYVATHVVHFCNQMSQDRIKSLPNYLHPEYEELYRVQVTSLDKTIPYRAPRSTPWPRVRGFENGVVDGEADSPYAQIDDQGRYLVKFHFDESDLSDGKASTYVRMMQPHGGTTEGFHFPLRKQTEVIFSFLGGDPDRPVIAGVVPNMVNPSPVEKSNHTQNVIRTGSDNHIILEDQQGKEFISIQTPMNSTGLYLGSPVGLPRTSFDGEGNPLNELFDGSIMLQSDGNARFQFGGHWGITCKNIDEFAKNVTELYDGKHDTTVTTGRVEDVSAGVTETYKPTHKTTVTGTRTHTVTGAVTETYGPQTLHVKGAQTITADGFRNVTASAGEKHGVTGWYTNNASAGIHLDAPAIHAFASGDIILKAPSVEIISAGFKQTDPSGAWNFATFDWNGSKKSEVTGVAIGFTGVKIEGHAAHAANSGFALITRGGEKKDAGGENENKGLKLCAGSVASFLEGLTTFA